jgi:hypothetical protein
VHTHPPSTFYFQLRTYLTTTRICGGYGYQRESGCQIFVCFFVIALARLEFSGKMPFDGRRSFAADADYPGLELEARANIMICILSDLRRGM